MTSRIRCCRSVAGLSKIFPPWRRDMPCVWHARALQPYHKGRVKCKHMFAPALTPDELYVLKSRGRTVVWPKIWGENDSGTAQKDDPHAGDYAGRAQPDGNATDALQHACRERHALHDGH